MVVAQGVWLFTEKHGSFSLYTDILFILNVLYDKTTYREHTISQNELGQNILRTMLTQGQDKNLFDNFYLLWKKMLF